LERLYREHAERLYAFLAYSCGDAVQAEDLLADVFERALRNGGRFDPRRGSETTWLYAIAVNRLRDHGRRIAAERRAVDRLQVDAARGGAAAHDAVASALARRDELASAVACLSEEEREVVALRFGADLTLAQVAQAVQQPRSTVEARLYRALRKLHGELAE
jgi:RNA polymerase sigma-70 factor (ECF subfamily)